MNTREEKEMNQKRLCYKCDTLKDSEDEINYYGIWRSRGYGSIFDNDSFTIQICNKCTRPEYKIWFDENPVVEEGYVEFYEHEENIWNLIKSFVVENQEYVLNDHMDRSDWIAMENGTLPDEAYEEYGMYSPRQIRAYEERFPTCEHPVNAAFNDNSVGCYCPFGASGNKDQEVDGNISSECFGCTKYKFRESPRKEMSYETYQKYELYIRGKEVSHLFEYKII